MSKKLKSGIIGQAQVIFGGAIAIAAIYGASHFISFAM